MSRVNELTAFTGQGIKGVRLINAKFPPIHVFEDVADPDEFEALYELQSLTNPRIQTELGNLALLSLDEIPFGIRGCQYATASFTHVNPDGSRFSDGSYGLMYIADSSETAIAEVRYHQESYWQNVTGLHYDRVVFKELICTFDVDEGLDATGLPANDPIYDRADYGQSRLLGREIKSMPEVSALKYASVRMAGGICHALFTPRGMSDIIPAKHYEMIWDRGAIGSVNEVSNTGA